MNEKILSLLKQTYSSFGLGDALLKAIADGLAAGATEENIESLVASQKPILEAMQKANDKRATDAVNKAKAEAEAAAKAAKDEDERRRAELAKQIEQLQNELKAQGGGNNNNPPKSNEVPDWFTAEQKRVAEQMQQMMEGNKKMLESLTALKKENDAFKAAKAAEERASYISKTARELGVPEWREKEGFSITDKMTDDEIKTYLTEVSNNIRTNMTGSNRFGVPQFPDNAETTKESAKRVAAALVDQM